MGDRFARRHHGELSKAVDHVGLFRREMARGIVRFDLSAVRENANRRFRFP